jgi:hypothetical protein
MMNGPKSREETPKEGNDRRNERISLTRHRSWRTEYQGLFATCNILSTAGN